MLERFYSLGNHEKQNIYLRGCVSVKKEDDIRHGDDEEKRRSSVYTV